MKKIILIMTLVCSSAILQAQILTPVQWAYAGKRISKTEAMILIKATIDKGWHIYSQNVKDGGPVKTSFKFEPSKFYSLFGRTIEPTPLKRMEKAYGMEVSFFEKSVIFQQRVKLNGAGKVNVKGTIDFMTCNDEKCLPPENLAFSVEVK